MPASNSSPLQRRGRVRVTNPAIARKLRSEERDRIMWLSRPSARNSGSNGEVSPRIENTNGFFLAFGASMMPLMYLTDCSGPPTVIEITTLPMPGSSSSAWRQDQQVRYPNRLCRQVEWIVRRNERRQPLLQRFGALFRKRRHIEADGLAEIVRNRAERAGEGENTDALGRRFREPRKDFRGVRQFVEGFHQRNAGMRHLRTHDLIISGQSAGMRLRCLLRCLSAARMHQDHRLARSARGLLRRQEILRAGGCARRKARSPALLCRR